MNESITLEKIDILRQRAGVTYKKAYETLQETGGDVVRALIKLEEEPLGWTERFQVSGSELAARLKDLIREGNVNRIIVRRGEKVLLDIPVTVGAVSAVLMPYLIAIGMIAAVVTRCTIEVERRGPASPGRTGGYRVPIETDGAGKHEPSPANTANIATPGRTPSESRVPGEPAADAAGPVPPWGRSPRRV